MDSSIIIIIIVVVLYICIVCCCSLSGGGVIYVKTGTKAPKQPIIKTPSTVITGPQTVSGTPLPASTISSQPALVSQELTFVNPETPNYSYSAQEFPTSPSTVTSAPSSTPSPQSSSGANTILASCPTGYTNTDGPAGLFCYENCPANWPGQDSPHFCQHNTIYSTVGSDTTKSIPDGCDTNLTSSAGLCYNLPDNTWQVTSPGFIGKKCPSTVDGQTISDSGTTCWYDRDVGTVPTYSCPTGQVQKALDCYQAPPVGYDWTTPGGLLIGKVCPSGSNDSGTNCWYDRGVGTIPTYSCPTGQVQKALDCYQNPPTGYDWTTPGGLLIGKVCPSGTTDTGTMCVYGRGVGRIPDKQPCSTWDSSWRDDGTSCWEDLKCNTYCNSSSRDLLGNCYVWDLKTDCGGCGCIKKTLFDRQGCNANEELYAGLCYPKAQSGFTCVGPTCSISKDVKTGTRVGTAPTSCPTGKVMDTGMCYTAPKTGFTCAVTNCSFSKDVNAGTRMGVATGSCPTDRQLEVGMCYIKPKTGFTCAVTNCSYSKQVQSQIGTLPTGCPDNRTLVGRLCYPACSSGYERRGDNLEYCSTICPSDYTNIGIGGCRKPTLELTKVGTCPTGYTKNGASCSK